MIKTETKILIIIMMINKVIIITMITRLKKNYDHNHNKGGKMSKKM